MYIYIYVYIYMYIYIYMYMYMYMYMYIWTEKAHIIYFTNISLHFRSFINLKTNFKQNTDNSAT